MNTGKPTIRVTIVYATPDRTLTAELQLPEGSTVADALTGAADAMGEISQGQRDRDVGVFGKRCDLQRVLQDGDRMEIYRPLAMDAKSARRLRARAVPRPPGRKEGEGEGEAQR